MTEPNLAALAAAIDAVSRALLAPAEPLPPAERERLRVAIAIVSPTPLPDPTCAAYHAPSDN